MLSAPRCHRHAARDIVCSPFLWSKCRPACHSSVEQDLFCCLADSPRTQAHLLIEVPVGGQDRQALHGGHDTASRGIDPAQVALDRVPAAQVSGLAHKRFEFEDSLRAAIATEEHVEPCRLVSVERH